MEQLRRNNSIMIQPQLCLLVAFALLLVPWQWVLSWIVASSFHEFCHYIAIRLCKCRVWQVKIGPAGVIMKTDGLLPGQEAICAFAGPLGSALLFLAAPYLPRVAICGVCQFAYNMLPVYPHDGGRIIGAIIGHFFSVTAADKVIRYMGNATVIVLCILSLYAFFWLSSGMIPIIATIMLWLKIKIPCKEGR